jgi:hypothetical protein
MAYRGARLLDKDGKKTTFYVDHAGVVYDNQTGGVRRVGRMSKDGKLTAKAKYLKKFAHRLKVIAAPPEKKDGK